jgi:hypothetical protein
MFVGSINADLRSILAQLAPAWPGLPVYVGCSGNFTVERILAAHGLSDFQPGWYNPDGAAKHKGQVPLATVFGTDEVPAQTFGDKQLRR